MNKDFENCFDQKKTGYYIISLMNERKMTQEALAEHIGVSPRCIRYWTSGKSSISMKHACRLCKFFNITMDRLIAFS